MARPRSPNRDKAYKIYKRHKGDISNKRIAEILHEDPKTVSKWKKLDKWEEKIKDSEQIRKSNSKNDEEETSYDYAEYEDPIIEDYVEKEINSIDEIEEITEKQILFCIYYTKYFNATKAYKKAYNCNMTTARVNGCKLLAKTNIQIAIAKLKQNRLNRAMLSPDDIFQKYMDIAFVDISDYITFGKMDIKVGIDSNGLPVYQKVNYVDYNDSEEVDGTLIKEFKEGRNGFSIKLEDRMKALEWLANHMDLATEEQRARVDSLRNKIKIDNEILELKKKEFERDDW